jgi:ribose/xylose/arabinose/galactoside ABC-type transport system permease subunit
VIGLFSLRVRAIFFAMITLAVASAFLTLASQLSEITGGEDGLTFKVPRRCSRAPSTRARPSSAPRSTAASSAYYLVFFVALLLVLALLRIVNSPFGRVLQAIRENDFRAEAIGYRTVVYRTIASVASALFATLAGVLLALWLRYNGPDTTLSFEIMLDVLLIVVIGAWARSTARRRQRAAGAGAELPAGPDEDRRASVQDIPVLFADRLARPLAALARDPVRALGLLLPERRRRPAPRDAPPAPAAPAS